MHFEPIRFILPCFIWASLIGAPLKVDVNAESALLINADTGSVLYEKNSRLVLPPASITKVATALYALKLRKSQMEEPVTASGDAIGTVTVEAKRKSNYTLSPWWLEPGSAHIGIKKGEILKFKDLLYGMMLASGDDASNVIAEWAGGSIPAFMKGMNDYLKSLGCQNTQFMNPHGLYHPDHKTCAADMAIIMREALKDPEFRKIIKTVTYTRPKTNKQEANTLVQTNRLLRPGPFLYSKTIGGKTGYIQAAQNTFVVAAQDKGRTLIAVLMKDKERTDLWRDSIKLFEAAFNQAMVEKVFLKKGIQKFTLNKENFREPLETYTREDLALSYYPAEEPKAKGLIFWDNVSAPIQKDEKVGEFRVVDEKNQVLKSIPLYAAKMVKATWLESLFSPMSLLIAAIVLTGGYFVFNRFKKSY